MKSSWGSVLCHALNVTGSIMSNILPQWSSYWCLSTFEAVFLTYVELLIPGEQDHVFSCCKVGVKPRKQIVDFLVGVCSICHH